MKFLQLVSVSLAALVGSSFAAPTPAPAPLDPVITATDLYTKFGGSSMAEGTTYKAVIKWAKPAQADSNAVIEAARVAVNAKHFAYATAKVKKTVKKGTKTKPDQITMDVEGFVWDLQLGTGGAAVSPGAATLESKKSSILKAEVTVTRGASTKKTKAQIDTIATTYIAGHGTFDATTNNCKTFSDHMSSST
ncbi:hypothetical protein RB595_003491 [Gaeumannomyces hyphopodioides]